MLEGSGISKTLQSARLVVECKENYFEEESFRNIAKYNRTIGNFNGGQEPRC